MVFHVEMKLCHLEIFCKKNEYKENYEYEDTHPTLHKPRSDASVGMYYRIFCSIYFYRKKIDSVALKWLALDWDYFKTL